MSIPAREAILSRVRSAIGPNSPEADYERRYQVTGALSHDERIELFQHRLADYGAGVFPCRSAGIASIVADRLRARGAAMVATPPDIPKEWLPAVTNFVEDLNLTYQQIEACDGVLTGCAVAIADTGTIILDGGSFQGRRALTLLPDYHLCLVFEAQVFETVPEALRSLTDKTRVLTLISGPSATADIEMTRIQGVHGPRHLEVILVSS